MTVGPNYDGRSKEGQTALVVRLLRLYGDGELSRRIYCVAIWPAILPAPRLFLTSRNCPSDLLRRI
jgi:hypothetical protein